MRHPVAGVFFLACALGGTLSASAFQTQMNASLSPALRTDELKWNIAGNDDGQNPNILSELTWTDVQIQQLSLDVEALTNNVIVTHLHMTYGWIVEGDTQDSDYLGDNRTQEFSRSYSKTRDGRALDLSVSGGQRFRLGRKSPWAVTPLVGYAIHREKFIMTAGRQAIPADAPIPGLASTYKAKWTGPWVGAEGSVLIQGAWEATAGFEYHWAGYDGEADWNLRDDLAHPISFTHEARGKGLIRRAALRWHYQKLWSAFLQIQTEKWTTRPGEDRFYPVINGVQFYGTTQLNEVIGTSKTFRLGLSRKFGYQSDPYSD